VIAADGHSVKLACRVLEVTRAGYYASVARGPSLRAIRHAWLTDVIAQIHAASRGTYGAPRVHAELRLGRGIVVGHNAVAMLMRRAGIVGLPLRRVRHAHASAPTASDLVDRQFAVIEPDVLWVTDITEHPTREGKLYCCSSSTRTRGGSWAGRSTPANRGAGHKRPGYGDPEPLTRSRHDRARRSRRPIHLVGVYDEGPRGRAPGVDGVRRRRPG
jgi:hypothetical protein